MALFKIGGGDLEKQIQSLQNSLTTLNNSVAALNDDMFYKSGDTFILSGVEFVCVGIFTDGNHQIRWTIPTEKRLDNIKGITLESIKTSIRHPKGAYMAGEGGAAEDITKLGTVSVATKSKNVLGFTFVYNKQMTEFTNNVPVVISMPELKLTFR